MRKTLRHSLQGSVHFKPCLRHEHVMVLRPVLQLQRTVLSSFGGAGGIAIVTGIILPF